MKLSEAERLINNWRECKSRMSTVNDIASASRTSQRIYVQSGQDSLELTPIETKMLMNILHNTIYEREQNLRERITDELHIDVEA